MRLLIIVVLLSIAFSASAQEGLDQRFRDPESVLLPGCEKVRDLRHAFRNMDRAQAFQEDYDYKFLDGITGCDRVRIRSRSTYHLHSFFAGEFGLFSVYEVRGGRGHRDNEVVGYVVVSEYDKRSWEIADKRYCSMSSSVGNCLLPRDCMVFSGRIPAGTFHKLPVDEVAIPPYCFGVGRSH
tara:strand:+ start:872 stop:1417 length:546 start_codon:yes stop_codon:yes gene_type:complete